MCSMRMSLMTLDGNLSDFSLCQDQECFFPCCYWHLLYMLVRCAVILLVFVMILMCIGVVSLVNTSLYESSAIDLYWSCRRSGQGFFAAAVVLLVPVSWW